MGEGKGWVSLDRKLLEDPIWRKRPYSEGQAWVELILMANHKDTKAYYQGQIVEFKRGTITTSMLSLAERWGWERKKLRRFLKVLEVNESATITTSTHGTTITLTNYDFYQGNGTTTRTGKRKNISQPLPQPLPINNNDDNELNNENKSREQSSRFTPPALEEVKAYCEERGNSVNPQRFIDYYSSNGWKVGKNRMKDWKAAVRTWEQSQKGGKTDGNPNQRSEYYKTENLFG